MVVTFFLQKFKLGVLGAGGGFPATEGFVASEDRARGDKSGLRVGTFGQEDGRADFARIEVGFAV